MSEAIDPTMTLGERTMARGQRVPNLMPNQVALMRWLEARGHAVEWDDHARLHGLHAMSTKVSAEINGLRDLGAKSARADGHRINVGTGSTFSAKQTGDHGRVQQVPTRRQRRREIRKFWNAASHEVLEAQRDALLDVIVAASGCLAGGDPEGARRALAAAADAWRAPAE